MSTDNDQEFWFARRYPVGDIRNQMDPVSRRALSLIYVFVGALVLGAIIFWMLTANGLWYVGAIVFVAIAGFTGYQFIRAMQTRGDRQHTVDDYKAGRVPGQRPYMEP